MTEAELVQIEQRANRDSVGAWSAVGLTPQDVPALVAEVRRLQALLSPRSRVPRVRRRYPSGVTPKMAMMLERLADDGPLGWRHVRGRIQLDGRVMTALMRRKYLQWAPSADDGSSVVEVTPQGAALVQAARAQDR